MIYVMSGLPGSGKSTWAENAKRNATGLATIVSADYYFSRDGEYKFAPNLLPDAHTECLCTFLELATKHRNDEILIIVDNTNISNWERAVYMMIGRAYKHDTTLIILKTPIEVCIDRNIHGVSEDTIRGMAARTEEPFRHWKYEVIYTAMAEDDKQ